MNYSNKNLRLRPNNIFNTPQFSRESSFISNLTFRFLELHNLWILLSQEIPTSCEVQTCPSRILARKHPWFSPIYIIYRYNSEQHPSPFYQEIFDCNSDPITNKPSLLLNSSKFISLILKLN